MTTVAYLGGAWATNIGNSFYNVGILHLLRRIVGPSNVYFVPNLAAWYWTSPNIYDPVLDVDADLVLMSGPCLSADLEMFRPLFSRLHTQGRQIAFISVGAGTYTASEQQLVSDLLNEFPGLVRFVATRDRETFDRHRGLPCPTFDGICGSMFLDEAVCVPTLSRPPYVALSVEAEHEPALGFKSGRVEVQAVASATSARPLRRLRTALTQKRPGGSSEQTTVGPFDIVRTQHRPFTRDADALFDRPATHYAVIPDGYLAIYKSADLVISNRVHACAAAMVLGSAAWYLAAGARSIDGRWFLLDRVGAGAVRERATNLDHGLLADEKGKLEAFITAQL